MRHGPAAAMGLDFLHQQSQSGTHEKQNCQDAERFDEAEEGGLTLDHVVDLGDGLLVGGGGIHAAAQ